MIEMRVVGVRIEMPHQQPVLVLTETEGERSLPIMIGSSEAASIAMHLKGVAAPRPLTHDLFKDVIEALGFALTEVRVVDFKEGTFYGELVFGDDIVVSARPSDAVALAVRCQVPVYASDAVMDQAGMVLPDISDDDDPTATRITDPEGEMERFREFLDQVSPEDFDPEGVGPESADPDDSEHGDAGSTGAT